MDIGTQLFTDNDRAIMLRALSEARKASSVGNFPAGAVLVVDGIIVGSARSSTVTGRDWSAHAELKVLRRHSRALTARARDRGGRVELFASVEPCLMCFSAAI